MPRVSKNSKLNDKYVSSGVVLTTDNATKSNTIKILYDGLLAKSGANDVYARVGFGNTWTNLSDYKMQKSDTGFEILVPVEESSVINVCFKDSANNWDNNAGRDYVFEV